MLTLTILVAVMFLLTLLIPWPWALAPGLLLAPLAPLLCCRTIRQTRTDDDWRCIPENMDVSRLRAVSVEPEILIGKSWLQAELWMPFDRVDGERFRSQRGAIRLSAAIALTADLIDPNGPVSGCSCEEIDEWLNSLGIVRETFRRQNPKLDDARVSGFPGVVVADGKEVRAYFIGSPALAQACHHVLDGAERVMTAGDRKRLAQIPANTLCYATSSVTDGHLDALCYLGSVRPVKRCSPSLEALRAGEQMHSLGISVFLSGRDRWMLQTVREMGIEWPEDEGSADVLELIGAREGEDQPRDFAAPVLRLLQQSGEDRYYRLLSMMFGAALWLAATLCDSCFPFLAALICLCGGILLTRELPLPRPPAHTWKSFLIPMAPGALLPAALHFFLAMMPNHAHAGAMLCMAEAAVLTIGFLSLLLPDRRAWYRLAAGGAICLTAALAIFLTMKNPDPITLLFGILAGMLIGIAILLAHKYLATGESLNQSEHQS